MATLNIKGLDDALYEKLKQRAQRQHRSVAQETTRILEEALGEVERLSILDLEGLGRHAWRGLNAAEHVGTERDAWD